MPTKPPVVTAAAILCALFGAPASARAAPQACELLTRAQVTAAVGSNVTAGQAMGVNSCNWQTPADASGHVVVTLRVENAKWFGDAKAKPVAGSRQAAGGIGDDAFFDQLGDLTMLSVKKGDSSFFLRVYGIKDAPRQRTIETTLARDVVAKL
jgi:hypothetical protein